MRGIALAQVFKSDGVDVAFITRDLPGGAQQLIRDNGFDVVLLGASIDLAQDAEATREAARARGAGAVVVDLGHADMLAQEGPFVQFLQSLSDSALAVIVIEGMGDECMSMRRALPVAAVVVPYLGAEKRQYVLLPGVRLFSGARYFPFRTEFASQGGKVKVIEPVARRILVSIGGGDVARHNRKVFAALSALGRADLDVWMTGEAPSDLKAPFQLRAVANSRKMAELIRWADLAVIGSGLIRYETALLATPAVVFSIRPAHGPMVEEFAATGAACHGGLIDDVCVEAMAGVLRRVIEDASLRAGMSRQGGNITDGQGTVRLATGLRQLIAA